MDETLLKDVGKYMYPFIGNTGYDGSYYFDALVRKYGKKTVLETIAYIQENGSPFSAFK